MRDESLEEAGALCPVEREGRGRRGDDGAAEDDRTITLLNGAPTPYLCTEAHSLAYQAAVLANWGGTTPTSVAAALDYVRATTPNYTAAGDVGTVWAVSKPTTVASALDRIAAALATELGTPIP